MLFSKTWSDIWKGFFRVVTRTLSLLKHLKTSFKLILGIYLTIVKKYLIII